MSRFKRYTFIFILTLLSQTIFSQEQQPVFFRQNFAPALDSIIPPPLSCDEAATLVIFDSVKGEVGFIPQIAEQEKRIQALFTELTIQLTKNRSNRNRDKNRPGDGAPPSGFPDGRPGPPGGGDDEMKETMTDMNDAKIAIDKITVEKEKFKNAISNIQTAINEKIRKTPEQDFDSRIVIMNHYMDTAKVLYDKLRRTLKAGITIIDEINARYGYGEKMKFPPLRNEIYKLQMEQVESLKFLINVTKQFTAAGFKFYNEKLTDKQPE